MGLILVTGANGALGIALSHQLKDDKYFKAYSSVGIDFNRFDREIGHCCGDLTNKSVLSRIEQLVKARTSHAYNNKCVIVNCAASLKLSNSKNTRSVNTKIPQVLQELSQKYGAELIHISSCSIYKQPEDSSQTIDEESALEATSEYERSKILADRHLIKHNKGETTILRPGLIYGGGTRHLGSLLAAIPSLLRSNGVNKIPLILGGPRTNWIHVQDLAKAICCVIKKSTTTDVYNIVEPEAPTFGYVTTEVCRLGGLQISNFPVIIPAPKYFKKYINKVIKNDFVFHNVNFLLELFSKQAGMFLHNDGLNLSLEKEMCTYLEGNMMFDGSLFREHYDFMPEYKTIPGWEEAMDWYELTGWINHV